MRIVVMMVLTGPLPCDYCPLLGGSAVNGFSVTHSNILLRSPSAHSNSVLTFPNYIHPKMIKSLSVTMFHVAIAKIIRHKDMTLHVETLTHSSVPKWKTAGGVEHCCTQVIAELPPNNRPTV